MADTSQGEDIDKARVMLGLLESVERDGGKTQRRLAAELGIALGLVNAYLKRCIKKGLVKASEAPARRYVYYLTPQGLAEKSRLTVQYLSYSLVFFKQAKADCSALMRRAQERGQTRIVLAGQSDLAEVAAICAMDTNVAILAIVDPKSAGATFLGRPVVADFDAVSEPFDAVLITELISVREVCERAIARLGPDRVLIPELLRQWLRNGRKGA